MGGVFHVLKDIQKRFHLVVLLRRVQNIKIGDVVTLADDVVGIGIDLQGRKRTNHLFFYLCLPQSMKIAVSVNLQGCFVRKGEGDGGSRACREALSLTPAVGFQVDPKNEMLLGHGMLYRADGYPYGVFVPRDHGNVLFLTGIGDACLQLGHLLTAAHHGNTRVVDHTDQIAAMLADIKFLIVTHIK